MSCESDFGGVHSFNSRPPRSNRLLIHAITLNLPSKQAVKKENRRHLKPCRRGG